MTGDDPQPRNLGQRCNDVFDKAVGEEFLFRLVRHCDEWQHGDAGFVWQRHRNIIPAAGQPDRTPKDVFCLVRDRNIAQEPKPAPRHGLDQRLLLAAVAQGFPGRIDTGRDGGIGNGAAGPNHVDQFIPTDHPVGIRNQMAEDIKNLRLQWAHLVRDPELKQVRIQFECSEFIQHVDSKLSRPVEQGLNQLLQFDFFHYPRLLKIISRFSPSAHS